MRFFNQDNKNRENISHEVENINYLVSKNSLKLAIVQINELLGMYNVRTILKAELHQLKSDIISNNSADFKIDAIMISACV